jgi:hypothetical protein
MQHDENLSEVDAKGKDLRQTLAHSFKDIEY